MIAPPRTIRLSESAKDQLSLLKRRTGIQNWNVLCRWAVCRSLAEESAPSAVNIGEMSNVEMSWPVFAGDFGDLMLLLTCERTRSLKLPLDEITVQTQLRLHLHRGIATLAASGERIQSLEDLVRLALPAPEPKDP